MNQEEILERVLDTQRDTLAHERALLAIVLAQRDTTATLWQGVIETMKSEIEALKAEIEAMRAKEAKRNR